MQERRIVYVVSLLVSLLFYIIYQGWFSWILLVTLALLPWLSLALSYPAMRDLKVSLQCPPVTRMGVPAKVSLQTDSDRPTPPVDCRIRLVNSLTGDRYTGVPGELIPTEHCGRITVTLVKSWACDYLGIFRRKLPQVQCVTYVLPKPVAGERLSADGKDTSVLRPKPGGGLAELHELRLYRPGDELRYIHWKASAKTGKLIYREAMEPAKKGYVLSMVLSGTPSQLDRKLGQLLWSSRMLLNQKRPHQIRCLTGRGLVRLSVTNENTLEEALRQLVAMPCAKSRALPAAEDALWHQQIGGDGDEA